MRISSSITLLLKLFIPIFWGVIFVSFSAMIWIMDTDHTLFGRYSFRMGTSIFVFLGLVILYFTLFSLKRVEVDKEGYFITNYFRTFRFPFAMIRSINTTNLIFGFLICRMHFQHKTAFGKSIFFITSRKRYSEYQERYTT